MRFAWNVLFVIFLSAVQVNAQTSELEWYTDIEAAKIAAADQNKNILMVFAGSDWCRPCIQFKKDILLSESFAAFSSDKLVVLYLDFPAKKKNRLVEKQRLHNEALAERYNKSGVFPKILLINQEQAVLLTPVFNEQSPEDFFSILSPYLHASK